MTRANAAKDKAARLAAQRHVPVVDPERTEEQPPAAAAAARSVEPARKNVRLTLDLAPALYDDFEDWRREGAKQLGRGRIKSVDVLRVLLRRLMSDDELGGAVIEALRQEGGR